MPHINKEKTDVEEMDAGEFEAVSEKTEGNHEPRRSNGPTREVSKGGTDA